jgi:RNA polymerase sigma-70 factor, ECF subfamily
MDDNQQHEVAQGLREGRPEAWHALYDAYAAQVWTAVARLLGPGTADVADVVQETFLAAARSARNFDPAQGRLWNWLVGIARNQVALHYRSRARHDRIRQSGEWFAAGHPQVIRWLENREVEPSAALAAAETALLVRTVLAELSDDYAILLTSKYLDGASLEEIAARQGSASGPIRSKLARARQAFREAFAKGPKKTQVIP